jgi:hypothetical protein
MKIELWRQWQVAVCCQPDFFCFRIQQFRFLRRLPNALNRGRDSVRPTYEVRHAWLCMTPCRQSSHAEAVVGRARPRSANRPHRKYILGKWPGVKLLRGGGERWRGFLRTAHAGNAQSGRWEPGSSPVSGARREGQRHAYPAWGFCGNESHILPRVSIGHA